MSPSIPVTILSGCARSGKTSFLLRLQRQSLQRRTAIIGKELAEHPSDLAAVLLQMKMERDAGLVAFDRVIVECSSAISPARPALGLFMEQQVATHYTLDAMVTIVDALHGLHQLEANDVAVEQVVFAQRLLLSKTDLVGDGAMRLLHQRLRALNGAAPVRTLRSGWTDLDHVFDTGAFDLGRMLMLEPRFFNLPDQPRRSMPTTRATLVRAQPGVAAALH